MAASLDQFGRLLGFRHERSLCVIRMPGSPLFSPLREQFVVGCHSEGGFSGFTREAVSRERAHSRGQVAPMAWIGDLTHFHRKPWSIAWIVSAGRFVVHIYAKQDGPSAREKRPALADLLGRV